MIAVKDNRLIIAERMLDMGADVNAATKVRCPRLFMVALCNRVDHIYFHAVSSFFISSPNLSRRRLDVCHTSTHGVALVLFSSNVWKLSL